MSKNAVVVIVACLVAALLGFVVARNSDVAIDVTHGSTKVKLDAKGGSIDHEKVLELLFNNTFLRGAAEKWLSEKHSIVSLNDDNLASFIERNACAQVARKPDLEEKIMALRECAASARNDRLRDLALRRRAPPFHAVPAVTQLTVPARRDAPAPGFASICDRDLVGRKIEVYLARTKKSVFVTPTSHIPCSGIAAAGTMLQLNPNDAAKLFGGEKPATTELVYVVAAQ